MRLHGLPNDLGKSAQDSPADQDVVVSWTRGRAWHRDGRCHSSVLFSAWALVHAAISCAIAVIGRADVSQVAVANFS